MNLHYGINAVVDYGLHDEDGGKIIYPFFTTDEGFLRTRVEQNTDALENELYEGSSNTANWDNLRGRDLTSLFSLLNTVVVTDQKTTPEEETGKLRISKTVSGENLPDRRKRPVNCESAKPYPGKTCPIKIIPTTSLSKSL